MNDFSELVDLASERLGGRVLLANDEFFAPKENLLKAPKPVFAEDKYTDRGKWMDGWETRRRRSPGCDWCIVQLGIPGILRGTLVDTSFFRGNYPEHASLEACAIEGEFPPDPDAAEWTEVLRESALKGDSQNTFEIADPHRYTHLRFKIYPDGGVARLRVYGEALPHWSYLLAQGPCIDLAAVENGGRVVACNDMFFSAPLNLLMPGKSSHMGDGWETKRRRGPGHDWVVIKLGIRGTIRQIEVDTSHFKGNFPESCSLEICNANSGTLGPWTEALGRKQLQANSVQRFDIGQPAMASHVRFNIYPDGGVARLRIRGIPIREDRMAQGLRLLNALTDSAARAVLMNCCSSGAWAQRMLAKRPFGNFADLFEAAEQIWWDLRQADWLEAFRHHPKIGEQKAAEAQSAQAQQWSEQEQQAVGRSSSQLLDELARRNQAYEQRFGYIFIACATGKSTEQMLASLNGRLKHDAESEMRVAAEEQHKITRLRLEKMLEL